MDNCLVSYSFRSSGCLTSFGMNFLFINVDVCLSDMFVYVCVCVCTGIVEFIIFAKVTPLQICV